MIPAVTRGARPRGGHRPGKRAILRAAVAVIGEHGYEGASMRDIAARAGVSPAAIYYHFPSKHHLLREFLEDAWQNALDRIGLEVAAAPDAPTAQLDIFVASLVASQHQDEFARLASLVAWRELGQLDPVERCGIERLQQLLLDRLEQLLLAGIEAGEFARVDAAEASAAIFSLTMPSSVRRTSTTPSLDRQIETAQRLAHRIVGAAPR